MASVVVFGSFPDSLVRFRGPLLDAMVAAGHEVHAVSPSAGAVLVDDLARRGVRHHAIPLARASLNPFADAKSLVALVSLLRRLRPEHLLAYTIKPVVLGGLAARVARVPNFHALITGLGHAFQRAPLRVIAAALYRIALVGARTVFFQNADNRREFERLGIVGSRHRVVTVAGSGVDLERYAPAPFPPEPSFLMLARLLVEKGVREYVAACREVRRHRPQARCRLAGWIDDNPTAIRREELAQWQREGDVEYLGYLDDVRPAIAASAVYVLPSYHEGMPRSVLEAMAMGRPIITTDAPGCRETVEDGVNGYRVPVRDSTALAQAMMRYAEAPELIAAHGAASRRLAEKRFDVRAVNRAMLDAMGLS